MSWNGKVVIVTGAASGIGAATAALFAKQNATVVIVDMNADAAREGARGIEAAGGKALVIQGDVTNERDVRAVAERTLETFGRIDALVNNAGIMRRHDSLEDWPLDEFRRIIDINLTGLFVTTQAIAPLMGRGGGGTIVNISSLGAILPVPYSPCYAAAKAGVLALTRSLAPLLEPHRVRINAILPSLVDTPLIKGSPMSTMTLPPGTLLKPGDIANAVVYVAGNSALNSAFFVVNGTPAGPRLLRLQDPPSQVEHPEQPF